VLAIRRIAYAATLFGLTALACDNDDNTDVQGDCANASPGETPNCLVNCGCGTGGVCVPISEVQGRCVSCDCDSDESCDTAGICHPRGHASPGACYGAPPLHAKNVPFS
jgi:hypothetical protein